jgi:hypothetical protein
LIIFATASDETADSIYPLIYPILWIAGPFCISTLYHICDERLYCFRISFDSWHYADVYIGFICASYTLTTVILDELKLIAMLCYADSIVSQQKQYIIQQNDFHVVQMGLFGYVTFLSSLLLHFDRTNVLVIGILFVLIIIVPLVPIVVCRYGNVVICSDSKPSDQRVQIIRPKDIQETRLHLNKSWIPIGLFSVDFSCFLLSQRSKPTPIVERNPSTTIDCHQKQPGRVNGPWYWVLHSIWHAASALSIRTLLVCRDWYQDAFEETLEP